MGTFKGSNITKIFVFSFARNSIIQFNADIQSFSDTFTANVNSEDAYGRIDPISTYSGTKRDISFSLILDSTTGVTADNFKDIKAMASRMYGRYKEMDLNNTTIPLAVLHSPPLFAIKIKPLIVGGFSTKPDNANTTVNGLLPGFITNFSISYDTSKGVEVETFGSDELIPREITLNFSFSPLHDRNGGFGPTGVPNTTNWPF